MTSPMQLVPIARKPILRLPSISIIKRYITSLNQPQKVIVISIGVSVALIGLVAHYLKRRKRLPRKPTLSRPNDPNRHRKNKPITIRNPSGEVHTRDGSVSPGFYGQSHRRGSRSERTSVASALINQAGESGTLTPQQYGVMGMESLESAIGLWEEALASYATGSLQTTALPSQDEADFTQLLQKVIEDSYYLQDHCESLFLNQHSVLFRSSAGLLSPDISEADGGDSFDRRTLVSLSSFDSFVSAQGDIADLRDLEEFEEELPPLYLAALKYHEDFGIPYRDVRTEWVRCNSDVEYICKVHCLRLSCQLIFNEASNKEWFAEAGRDVLQALLLRADKDPKDALSAYEDLLLFISECDWAEVEKELRARGVKTLTFYDVVLDFILIDAFEDLDNPPSSVLAVVQNRWLSNGFKESALTTAVWSVLKAKRRLMKYQDGFIAHFYDVTEHLSPVLAWGFLGPDHRLRDMCTVFRDQVQGLMQDMFNFSCVRYTDVEQLSEDILKLTHERYKILMGKLSFQYQSNGVL